MSLFTRRIQRLEITDTRATLLARRRRRTWEFLNEIETDEAGELCSGVLDKLLPSLVGLDRTPLRVIVPDRWCKLYLTRPPRNATRVEDLRDAAAARLRLVYDADPASHYILSDLSATRPFLCCAMERAVVDRLRDIGRSSGAQVESIRPQYVELLTNWKNSASHAGQWLISCDISAVTLGMFVDGCSTAIVQTRWNDIDWNEAAQIGDAVIREAIRADSGRPSSITLAGPPVRSLERLRTHDIDFATLALPGSARSAGAFATPSDSRRKATA